MNKKIKIYAIVLAIVYTCIILFYILGMVEPIISGYYEGESSAKSGVDLTIKSLSHAEVKPMDASYSFSTPISVNNKVLENVELDKIVVKQIVSGENVPSGFMFYLVVKLIVALSFLVCFIYVPFLFFKIVYAVTRGEMFDNKVLKRLNKIGWIVIAYYLVTILIGAVEVYFNRQFIQIDNYEIVFSVPDFIPFILGLVILFLAEVLRVGLFMKEEQDLTI